MKTLIAILIVLASFTAKAEDFQNAEANYLPIPTQIVFNNHMDRAVWVTIYNSISRISDNACLQPGESTFFTGYYPPFFYQVRGEVKEKLDCGGRTYDDITKAGRMTGWYGIDATMYRKGDSTEMDIHDGYNPLGGAYPEFNEE